MTVVTPSAAPLGASAHSDGGWGQVGYVPVQTRSGRFRSANPRDFPSVTGLEADWKLSPVALLRGLIDGELGGGGIEYSAFSTPGTVLEWTDMNDARIGGAGLPEDRASANAWSSTQRAAVITLTGEDHTQTVLTRSLDTADPTAAHAVIIARTGSDTTLVLESVGIANLVENIEIVVEDGARLTLVSIQEWGDDSLHLSSHFATVGRDSYLRHIVVSLGGHVVRVNPSVHLIGEGSNADLFGLYFADAGQHLEQRVYLDHVAPNTRGRVNYKGALQGRGARTVWVGDVLIGPQASGTDSYEQNRNLVLSEGTRADSIPNLEIETGDILGAGHASATGRFDDEQLFYLQARGISEPEARRLVVMGFLSEIVQAIGDDAIESRLLLAIEAELSGRRIE